MSGIWVVLELTLKYPWKISQEVLIELVRLWDMRLMRSGSNDPMAVIELPVASFKRIFGVSPVVGDVPVPKGTGSFLTHVKVREVKAL